MIRVSMIVAAIAMIFLPSCKSAPAPTTSGRDVSARLYDLSSAEIFDASFNFSGTTQGTITITLRSGEIYRGEYQTLRGGTSTWGVIYSSVWGQSSGYARVTPREYVGSAIAVSDQKGVIQCEYIGNSSRRNPHGQGACKDNRGKVYKLMY